MSGIEAKHDQATEYKTVADYAKAQDSGALAAESPPSRPPNNRNSKEPPWPKQRISYVPLEKMDAKMRAEMERCQREGTPRPESSAVRAHVPACFWFFAEFLEQHLPQRRARPRRQGTVPAVRVALGAMRILRQPALGQVGGQRRADRRPRHGPAELREIDQIQRAAEGRARLCRGDHLASQHRRRLLGPHAPQFQRAGAGRARLHDRPHARPAELAAAPQHRAPPGPGRHRRLDGAGLRRRRQAEGRRNRRRNIGRRARPARNRTRSPKSAARRTVCNGDGTGRKA